jgi:hypothetical protein
LAARKLDCSNEDVVLAPVPKGRVLVNTMLNRKVLSVCAALVSVAACAFEKSETPTTPTVAGPIAGVEISAPKPLEPIGGALISGDSQPITLLLENAGSNGQRPLTYSFEVATDAGFGNKLFTREGIGPGTNGRTSLRLPDPLGSGRSYYWRAKAQDGANAGPYSLAANFNLYTPLAFDKPIATSPVNNERVTSQTPGFRWINASRVGTPIEVSYVVEVATSDTFANKIVVWQFSEQPNTTSVTAGSALPGNMQLFWRVRAFQGGIVGPWSDTQVFRTPAPVVAPAPTPRAPGGSCASQATPLAVIQCRRAQYGSHMDPPTVNQFLILVAKDLTAGGHPVAPWGLLVKTSGSQCLGYSCDILCNAGGDAYDMLLDSDGAQTPVWSFLGKLSPSQQCVIQ